MTRLITINYEISSKNELYLFLSEGLYYVVNEDRVTENTKWLVFAAITSAKGLIMVIFEVLSLKKFKFTKTLYLTLFDLFYTFAIARLYSWLPQLVDKLMVFQPQLFGNVRLKTYDSEVFSKVLSVHSGHDILLLDPGCDAVPCGGGLPSDPPLLHPAAGPHDRGRGQRAQGLSHPAEQIPHQ